MSALYLSVFGIPLGSVAFATVSGVSANLSGSSGSWTIELSFDIPSGESTPTGYTAEVSVNGGSFTEVVPDSMSGTTRITYTFGGLSDGLYRYRVQANYSSEDSSSFVYSSSIRAFINLNFDFRSRFHTIAA